MHNEYLLCARHYWSSGIWEGHSEVVRAEPWQWGKGSHAKIWGKDVLGQGVVSTKALRLNPLYCRGQCGCSTVNGRVAGNEIREWPGSDGPDDHLKRLIFYYTWDGKLLEGFMQGTPRLLNELTVRVGLDAERLLGADVVVQVTDDRWKSLVAILFLFSSNSRYFTSPNICFSSS